MPHATLAMALMAPVMAAPAAATDPIGAINAAMDASAAGWNANDLERFVAIYSKDATFVGKDSLIQSRDAIAAHYRASFASAGNVRGKLSFQPLGHRALSKVHVIYWARWILTPAGAGAKPETGMTTLLFERQPDGWKIISDHSS